MANIVCPGNRLGRVNDFRAGPGTYVRGTYIFASVVGPKLEQPAEDGDKPFLIVSAENCALCLDVCACVVPAVLADFLYDMVETSTNVKQLLVYIIQLHAQI